MPTYRTGSLPPKPASRIGPRLSKDIEALLSEVEHRNSVAEIANSSPAFGVPHLGSHSFDQRLKRL
jgi:hypothetical protein